MTCQASSEHGPYCVCDNAINEKHNEDWCTNGEGAVAWIQLNFGHFYKLTTIKLKHRACGANPEREIFKNISLRFSDGTEVHHTLNNIPHTSGLEWTELRFSNITNPVSNYVNITASGVYARGNNGFSDIRVYGCVKGT